MEILLLMIFFALALIGGGKLMIRHWKKAELAKRAQRAKKLAMALELKAQASSPLAGSAAAVSKTAARTAVPLKLAISVEDGDKHVAELIRLMRAACEREWAANTAIQTLIDAGNKLAGCRRNLDTDRFYPTAGKMESFKQELQKRIDAMAETARRELSLPGLYPPIWTTKAEHEQALGSLSRAVKLYAKHDTKALPPALAKALIVARQALAKSKEGMTSADKRRYACKALLKEVNPTAPAPTPQTTAEQEQVLTELTELVGVTLNAWQVVIDKFSSWDTAAALFRSAVAQTEKSWSPPEHESESDSFRRWQQLWNQRFEKQALLPAAAEPLAPAVRAFSEAITNLEKRFNETIGGLKERRASRWSAAVVLPAALSTFKVVTKQYLERIRYEVQSSQAKLHEVAWQAVPPEAETPGLAEKLSNFFVAFAKTKTALSQVKDPSEACPAIQEANALAAKKSFVNSPQKPNDKAVADYIGEIVAWAESLQAIRRSGCLELTSLESFAKTVEDRQDETKGILDTIVQPNANQDGLVAAAVCRSMFAWLQARCNERLKPVQDLKRTWKFESSEPVTIVSAEEEPLLESLRKLCRSLGFAVAQAVVSLEKQKEAFAKKAPPFPDKPALPENVTPDALTALLALEEHYLEKHAEATVVSTRMSAVSSEARSAHAKRIAKQEEYRSALSDLVKKLAPGIGKQSADQLPLLLEAARKMAEVAGR